MGVGSSKYIWLCKWPRRDQPRCPGSLGGLHMLRSIKWGPSVSRRKANTTINLSLRSRDVPALHGKTPANAGVKDYTGTRVELIRVPKKWINSVDKYLIVWNWLCVLVSLYLVVGLIPNGVYMHKMMPLNSSIIWISMISISISVPENLILFVQVRLYLNNVQCFIPWDPVKSPCLILFPK